jgi:hypothetical protein
MKVVKFASTAQGRIMAITGVPLPPPLPRSYPVEDERIGRLSTFALETCVRFDDNGKRADGTHVSKSPCA